MRNLLICAAIGMLLVGGVGCNNNKSAKDDTMKMDAAKDDCPMCPGVQHAKADGTCPNCGMKVKG